MDFYQKNLQALEKTNPELFSKLQRVTENKKYEVFGGQSQYEINILDTEQKIPLYNNPVQDLEEHLKNFIELSRYPFLFFYGVGNGFLFRKLLDTYNFDHIIVTEPEIELLFVALNLSDFSLEIANNRIIFFQSNEVTYATAMAIMKLPEIGVYVKLYDLHQTLPYYNLYNEDMVKVNQIYISGVLQSVKNHGNDITDSLVGIEQFIKNIPLMLDSPSFDEFLDQKNSDLAVCVATGPSLTKQLPLLKEIQDYVTIITVDASMPVLEKWDIKPDIVTSLERIELTKTFFEKTSKKFQKDIIFAHSAIQNEAVLNASHGTKVVIMRPFGYMHAFELEKYGYAGIGMSAANFSLEIAFYMGFKKMCFIGQDLAYGDDGTTHASDHAFGANDKAFEKNVQYEDKPMIEKYGGGGVVQTNAVWVMFLNYFVQNVAEAKGIMECINATEGGARIEGTIEMPFEKVIEKYADRSKKKNPIKLLNRDKAEKEQNLQKAKGTVEDIIKYGEEIQQKTEKLFLNVAKLVDTVYNEDGSKKEKYSPNYNKVGKYIKEIDKIKAYFNEKKFRQYFWEGLRSLIIHQELEIAKIIVRHTKNEKEKKERNLDFLHAHKGWLY
ncbi:MAG: DUF115 domain-containing protein, partial [Campylobacterales bacterium]|nr:DUF115 domain-containing protein [Campylobacterales bacterium]